ncbi:MAG: DDE-type integrase/transposase/recombinase [Elusimicrobiota bacterium]
MKVTAELRTRVVELDRRYRSTWDAHAIGFVVGLSATTVAKILREIRGPRPKRRKQPHTRRTKFLFRDVMWSSDFVRLGWGWLLMRTVDEMSGFRLGWDLCRGEAAQAAVAHARSIVKRMGRAPLTWKFDHGSAFTSEAFQDLLAELRIVPYATQPHAPWTNGRVERDHQDIHAWLIPLILAGLRPLTGLGQFSFAAGVRIVIAFWLAADVLDQCLCVRGQALGNSACHKALVIPVVIPVAIFISVSNRLFFCGDVNIDDEFTEFLDRVALAAVIIAVVVMIAIITVFVVPRSTG